MFTPRRLPAASFLLLCLLTTGLAQGEQPVKVERRISPSSPTVTASATAERVRFTAPSNVVRMQLQVISESGQILFDVSSKGNVLEWSLQDGNGQRLHGSYVTVITVKSLSGRLSEKIGSVSIGERQCELQRVDATQLTAVQQQAVGPIEENATLTILTAGAEATTALANNGSDGQIIRDRGALSFRLGDFFSGTDIEQMRLTEEGNLGIGTDKPKAKLDVAGTIRTTKGIEFADGTVQTSGQSGKLDSQGQVVPNAGGTGTQGRIAKWTDGSGTLGDSVITESSGNIGIGTASPQAALHVIGNQYLKPTGATPTYQVLAGSDPSTTVMLTTDGSNFGWQIAPTNSANDTIIQVLGQTFASAPNRGEFGIYLGTTNSSAFKVIQRGGPERFRVNRNGNVGIGNNNPTSLLDVAGDINTSTQFNIGGSRVLSVPGVNNAFVGVGAGNLNTTGQQNSFFGANAGSLNTTGNRNSLFGSQAGMVTTNGANSFFGFRAGFQNSTGGFNSFFGDSAGTQNISGTNNTAIGSSTTLGSSNLTNATAIGAQAQVDASNALVLGSIAGVNGATASANVGIGTTSPSAKLEVSDNTGAQLFSTTFSGSNGFIGRFARGTSSSPTTTLTGDTLSFFGGRGFSPSVGFINASSAAIIFKATEDFTGAGNGASMIFETSRTGDGASERGERMRIDQNGNVGIGTSSTAAKLDVRDGTGASGSGAHVQIGAPISNPDEKIIVFGDSGCGGPCVFIGEQDSDDRMVLRSGIGGFRFKLGDVLPDVNGLQSLGGPINKWTAVYAVNGTIQTSDVRLKQGIANLKYGLNQVMQLRPVSFQWKAGNDKSTHLGLIAQEVDKVLPEAVQKSSDADAPLGMNYSTLIPVLIKAIQEQQGILERAQAELRTMRSENDALRKRIIAIETTATEAAATRNVQIAAPRP